MIAEIPLDQENIESSEIIEEELNEEKELINEEKEIKIEEKENAEKENVEPVKKPRGRPKGSTKPKKEKPAPPEKPKVVKAKPKPKKVVTYESESDEELPQYVRQQLPERDLATQMMQVLQQHNNRKADARKQLYSSWFKHY